MSLTCDDILSSPSLVWVYDTVLENYGGVALQLSPFENASRSGIALLQTNVLS